MSEEGITLTVWGNDGMPSDVIEGVPSNGFVIAMSIAL